jgi:LacI family transcriptional regulator
LLPGAPAVHSDVRAEAEEAFMHLWNRGFRQLGFCGVSNYAWAKWQHERFAELASEAGCKLASHVETLRIGGAAAWSADLRSIARWLEELPKPVGIFACYDVRGQQVLNACHLAGLRVPDDVAVVGVDNDLVRCSLSDPPLSSVVPDTHRIGQTAAEFLAKMMAGHTAEPGLRLIRPIGVVTRRSTDALAINDPDISAAIRFIRDNACRPIGVSDVLREVALSRRALEGKFVRLLGRTPHQEILRCRMEKARILLSETDLPVKVVACQAGIRNSEYFSVLFKRIFGKSPSACRDSMIPLPATMKTRNVD